MDRQLTIAALIALAILPVALIATIFSELQSMSSGSSDQNFWATIVIPSATLVSGWLIVGVRFALKKPEQLSRRLAKGANIMAGLFLFICALGMMGECISGG